MMAGAGGVKVSVAFNDGALVAAPTWTDVTALASSLVASYQIDRGRIFELDQTDSGTCTVQITDRDGLFDPTNPSGAYYGLLEPDLQVKIELWNPVLSEWQCRFRGWIEDFDYDLDDTRQFHTLKISVYDIFALLQAIEMQPGQFGDAVPAGSEGNLFFDNNTFQGRIDQVMGNAGVPADFYVAFTGNVNLLEAVYSPGESPLEVIQNCADAEFPGVSNIYPDRFGRLAAHGRLAKFDPSGTAASAGTAAWDWQQWKAGDGDAVAGSPSDTAQMRPPFSWNRGKSKIINSALCYPMGILPDKIAGQLVTDTISIGTHGIQSYSKENLLTESGILTGNNGNDETKLFSTYYVTNYKDARNRITALTFKSLDPADDRAAALWKLLCQADIADEIDVTATFPGGGGFSLEPFYIEGIHESVEPLTDEYAMVTLGLDVSPKAYFDNPVGLTG